MGLEQQATGQATTAGYPGKDSDSEIVLQCVAGKDSQTDSELDSEEDSDRDAEEEQEAVSDSDSDTDSEEESEEESLQDSDAEDDEGTTREDDTDMESDQEDSTTTSQAGPKTDSQEDEFVDAVQGPPGNALIDALPLSVRADIMHRLNDESKFCLRWSCRSFFHTGKRRMWDELTRMFDRFPKDRFKLACQLNRPGTWMCSACLMAHDFKMFTAVERADDPKVRYCKGMEGAIFIGHKRYLGYMSVWTLRSNWIWNLTRTHYLKSPRDEEPPGVGMAAGPRNWDTMYGVVDKMGRTNKYRVQLDPGGGDGATIKMMMLLEPPFLDFLGKVCYSFRRDATTKLLPVLSESLKDYDFPHCPHLSLRDEDCLSAMAELVVRGWNLWERGWSDEFWCRRCETKIDVRWHRASHPKRILQVSTFRFLGDMPEEQAYPADWEWRRHVVLKEERVGKVWRHAKQLTDAKSRKELDMVKYEPEWIYDTLKATQYEH